MRRMRRCEVNGAEKIEALREWVRSNDEPDFGQFAAGYLKALTEVRDIIDPPKPKWREAVDERLGWAAELPSPLGSTLRELADLEYGKVDSYADPTTVCLARIVAVCEAQVGDGWQADPARVGPFECGTDDLLDALLSPVSWTTLGCRAAEWLVRLTEDGDARTTPGCPACDGVAGTACRCAEHAPMPESHHHEYVQRWVCECGEQNDPVDVTPERPEHSPVSTADADDGCQCVCEDGTCESCAPRFAWAEYRKDYEPNDTVTAHKAFYAGFEGGLEYAWMREACDEYDKCEVPPVQVPHSSVLKLAKARAERAEAAIQRVRELCDRVARYHGDGLPCIKPRDIYRALEGE